MKITKELVQYVSALSRIKLEEEKTEGIISELSAVIDYMDMLNQVDTEDIEPLSHIFSISNVMRDDVIGEPFDREELLKNAPERTEETFTVPKTVE